MEAEITNATKKGKTVGKKRILQLLLAIALIGGSTYLLKGDVWTFWTWYLLALVLGAAAMPLTGRLFRRFQDRGWVFSKVTAIAVSGFLTWFLVAVKIIKFTTMTCIVVHWSVRQLRLFYIAGNKKPDLNAFRLRIWIRYMQRNFCFLRHFFSGLISRDSIRRHMVQKSLWIMVSWRP